MRVEVRCLGRGITEPILPANPRKKVEDERTGDDLTVVNGESDRQDILVMSYKATGGFATGNVPQTKFRIPRSRQGKGTIGRDDNIRNKVRMSTQGTTSVPIRIIIRRGMSELPCNDALITRR